MQIKSMKDFCAGLMFIGIGLVFAIGAFNYPMGSALRMGPAYFPSVLGWMLVVLGAIVFFDSFFLADPAPRPTKWRGLLWILGSVMAFGLLVDPLHGGLVVACFALMVMSAFGGYEFKWKEALINATFMTAACIGIFYFGLGLPFRLWPWS
jgi:hypothetical protein